MTMGTAPATEQPLLEAMTLSLGDVARLADVRREVVTVWRTRSAGTPTPFPAPLAGSDNDRPRYAAADVVEWLTATGRGNNSDAAREVVLHADVGLLDSPDPRPVSAVLALLALQSLCGELPTDVDELLDLADEHDPDDELLLAELVASEPLLPQLIPLAVALSEAAYGPAAASAAVIARRTRSASSVRRATLTSSGTQVLGALVAALVHRRSDTVLSDVTGAATGLLSGMADDLIIGAIGETGGAAARQARRTLVCDGVGWRPQAAPTLTLVGLPSAEGPTASDAQLLRTIADHRAGCTKDTVTLVWGPASALTDSVSRNDRARTDDDEECDGLRRRLLSSGQLRAIVRLPAGLRPSRSRERLALWCFGPTDEQQHPRTIVGDLAERTLDASVVSALVSDVLASLDGSRGLRARELEVSEIRISLRLTEQTGLLVPAARTTERARETAVLLDRFEDAGAQLDAAHPAGLALPTVRVLDVPRPPVEAVLSQLITERALRYRAGLRMMQDVDADHGGVRVLDARAGATPVLRVDRFDLNLKYPHLIYTDPGDVVFCTSGRPRAFVDRQGGAVVRFPSKVLSSRDPRLVPELLAAAINARAPREISWKTWTVALVDRADAPAVRAGIATLEDERQRLQQLLAGVDDAEQALLDLAAGGAVCIAPPPSVEPPLVVERRRSRDPITSRDRAPGRPTTTHPAPNEET